jgi:hypothetical protein
MLLYLHGDDRDVLVLMFIVLLVSTFLLTIFIIPMFLIYKFLKNSKNEIQELNLTEKEDKNS